MLTRRSLMASTVGALAAPRLVRAQATMDAPVATDDTADALFRELDDRIEAAMKRYQVPGVALGVWWQGREHLRGFGVTKSTIRCQSMPTRCSASVQPPRPSRPPP
jgi:hypothetical protein